MGLRARLAKMFFGDVIAEQVEDARTAIYVTDEVRSEFDRLDYLTKSMHEGVFPKVRGPVNGKGTKQVLSEPGSVSDEEGILPKIPFDVFNRMYEENTWIRAGIDVVRRAATSTGWVIVPTREGADPAHRDELQKFFDNPNPNDTMIDILDDTVRNLMISGNDFVEIVRNKANTKPAQLWSLNPDEMRIRIDIKGRIIGYVQVATGTRGHLARVEVTTGRQDLDRARFDARDVIHFKLGTKGSTVYGLAPLHSLVVAVTVDTFAQIYQKAFFKNGGKVRGMYFMKDATPEQVKRNRSLLDERAKRPEAAHSDLVLEGKVDWKAVGPNQKEMEFKDLRAFTRDEVGAVLGVPPSKIQIIETGNIGAGSGASQDKTFYMELIVPLQTKIAARITKKVIREGFGFDDWSFAFKKRDVDPNEQAKTLGLLVVNGIISADEAREQVLALGRGDVMKSANGDGDIEKRLKGSEATITQAPRGLVDLENQALRSFQAIFRKVSNEIRERLPLLKAGQIKKRLASVELPPSSACMTEIPMNFSSVYSYDPGQEILKQLEEAEEVLEPVKEDRFSATVFKWSGLAAVSSLALQRKRIGRRRGVKPSTVFADVSISRERAEGLLANAVNLDRRLRTEIAGGVREAIVEGVRDGLDVEGITARVEASLTDWKPIPVSSSVNEAGEVVRQGTVRRLSRNRRAEIIVRTEMNRGFNDAAIEAYDRAGERGAQYILSATADEECIAVANSGTGGPSAGPGAVTGNFFSIDEMSGLIPVHKNCRCSWAPLPR